MSALRRHESSTLISAPALAYLLCVFATAHCSVPTETGSVQQGAAQPSLVAVSHRVVRVGDPVRFTCQGCVERSSGFVEVAMTGTYKRDDGGSEPVDLKLMLRAREDGIVDWTSFGRYRIPFGTCAEGGDCATGIFEGEACPTNVDAATGQRTAAAAHGCLAMSLEVAPSLVVKEFFPFSTEGGWRGDCKYPVMSALAGPQYLLRFESVGFSPSQYTFMISAGAVVDGRTQARPTTLTYQRLPDERDTTDHAIIIEPGPVPISRNTYRMHISITGSGDAAVGEPITLDYAFMVRDPVSLVRRPGLWNQVAEVLPPKSISGCNTGHATNNTNTFSVTESRQLSNKLSHTLIDGWGRTQADQHRAAIGAISRSSRVEGSSDKLTTTNSASADQTTNASTKAENAYALKAARTLADTASSSVGTYERAKTETELINREHLIEIGRGQLEEIKGGSGGDFEFGESGSGKDKDSGGTFGVKVEAYGSGKGKDMRTLTAGNIIGARQSLSIEDNNATLSRGSAASTQSSESSESRSRLASAGIASGQTATLSEANSASISTELARSQTYDVALAESESLAENITESLSEMITVSHLTSKTRSVSHTVFAKMEGALYEQVFRKISVMDVVAFDLCGNGTVVGESILETFAVADEIALDDRCHPRTCLLPGQCVIDDYCESEYPSVDAQLGLIHPMCRDRDQRYRSNTLTTEFTETRSPNSSAFDDGMQQVRP